MQLAASASGSESLGGLQLMSNTIDWAVEEQGLLSIRSRGHFNRSLPPMAEDEQMLWEGANYLSAVLLVAALALWQRQRLQRRNRRYVEQFTA
jgi:ABC-2 type transport system permease protein